MNASNLICRQARTACALAFCLLPSLTQAVSVTPDELAVSRRWAAARFDPPAAGTAAPAASVPRLFTPARPFSFTFDGKASAELLPVWRFTQARHQAGAAQAFSRERGTQFTEHLLVWSDPVTGLEFRCQAVEYEDFPVVEWTLYFKNTSATNTPIIENIQALDIALDRGETGEFLLHHNVGSPADGNDYGPLETRLAPGSTKRLGGAGGRPTNADWSYVNLEWPGEGLIASVGWPGQWTASFVRDAARGLSLRAGQELARFKLLPGEEVRSPLIVLQFKWPTSTPPPTPRNTPAPICSRPASPWPSPTTPAWPS